MSNDAQKAMAEGFNHNPDSIHEIKAEVTVVNKAYHQPGDSDPTCVETGYSYFLETDEQPFTRIHTVGEDWIPLQTGWLTDSSLVIISNDGAKRANVVLTEEEEDERSKRFILVAFEDTSRPTIIIRPGRSAEFEPLTLNGIKIRCTKNSVRYTASILPR
jgi:hypothetical protein